MRQTLARFKPPLTARRLLSALEVPRKLLTDAVAARWGRQADGTVHSALSAIDSFMADRLGETFAARLERVPSSFGEANVDPFGLDPDWIKYGVYVSALLHRYYFRTEVFGIENVPEGRVLVVGNHSGQIPIDGALLAAALFLDAEPPRIVRAMVEKWSQTLPFVSVLFPRMGQVVGTPENAKRLLDQGDAILVFPEGARGISKPYSQRYKLEDFSLGFVRLALETKTPIVPVAIVGGEEQYISVKNVEALARLLHIPAFPILPQLLLPLGFLPLPTRYKLHFGRAVLLEGDPDDDDAVIAAKAKLIQSTIQSTLNRALKTRRSIFF